MKKRVTKKPAPKVKRVKLPATGIIQVVAPKGIVPVVAIDPIKNVIEIAPVRAAEKKSWWHSIFG